MSRRLTTSQFIMRARAKHGDDKYDYSKVEYTVSKNKVTIICPKHGEFQQTASKHMFGDGCSKCSRKNKPTTAEFKQRVLKVHGDTYDLSEVEYKDAKTVVKVGCKTHGIFLTTPDCLVNHGHGCQKCGEIKSIRKVDKSYYLAKFDAKYKGRYTYDMDSYSTPTTPMRMFCKVHGEFMQSPSNFLKKDREGCPKCSYVGPSKPEKELADFIAQYVDIITSDRKVLGSGKELDIVIPSKKLAFEFNGLFWHSDARGKDKKYHLTKTKNCEAAGYQLIHIFSDEWRDKKEIVKSRIKNLLGNSDRRIYARKCEVKEVDSKTTMQFLRDNHMQGAVGSKVKLGLYYNDELVSIMTFGGLRVNMGQKVRKEGQYELMRFCNVLNTSVVGGASKLLKYFERNYDVSMMISYADLRWSKGDLYFKLGFEHTHSSEPSYFYTKGENREYRFKYRKNILVEQGADPSMTEREIMIEKGYARIYDCGAIKFTKKL